VTDPVVGAPLRKPRAYRQDWSGAVQRLNLGLLIHAQHHRAGGWGQIQATQVGDLGLQLWVGGELERVGPPGLEVMLGPHPGDRHAADAQVAGERAGGPVGDAQLLGWRLVGERDDLGAAVAADGAGPSRAGLVVQSGQPVGGIAATPVDHRRP